jgi:hypothetical protein
MGTQADLETTARAIIDANMYMTLGTADEDGRPWVSPVYCAAHEYRELYWVSAQETTHTANLAWRPQLSIVVFDSQVPPGTGQAVYMSATAVVLDAVDVVRGLEVYPGPAERGARSMTPDQLQPPAPHRLFKATVSQHWILCPRTSGQLCPIHGRAYDHRTPVLLSR